MSRIWVGIRGGWVKEERNPSPYPSNRLRIYAQILFIP
jgi:hypothetical protein